MSLKRLFLFILVIFLLSLLAIFYPSLNPSTGNAVAMPYEKEDAVLLRVIDGDTIEAQAGAETLKIRLLGINTPEKNMPYANEAKNFLMQFENQTIQILRDWEDEDKYYRKLRYVFYDNRFLNLEILENGFANSYYESGLFYETQILRAEQQARNFEAGIWKHSNDVCSSCVSLKQLEPEEEFFVIGNDCNFDCSLEDWFVKDAGRNTFKLVSLPANNNQTYSSGNKEVWNNNGDKFFIFDKSGILVLYYEY